MNTWTGDARVSGGREKMDLDLRQNFRCERGKIQEPPRGFRKRASGQIDMHFLGEDENSASGHASGYERVRGTDKPFYR